MYNLKIADDMLRGEFEMVLTSSHVTEATSA